MCVVPPTPTSWEDGKQSDCACVPCAYSGLFLQNPALADIYTEHAHQVVVAKYAPSGFYVASGGTCGGEGRWAWRARGWQVDAVSFVSVGADKEDKPPNSPVPEVGGLQPSSWFQPPVSRSAVGRLARQTPLWVAASGCIGVGTCWFSCLDL